MEKPGAGCVWIVGASSGMGAALARRLAGEGHTLAVSARSREKLEDLAIEQGSGLIHPYALDVTDRDAVAQTATQIADDHGFVHTAVLCAGTYKAIPASDFDAQEATRQVEVNLIGVINTLDPLLKRMFARGTGRVAIVASLTSRFGLPQASVYGATKAALVNLAEALRVECAERGVVVQVINPGFVETPLTEQNDFEMPFLVSSEDAVTAITRGLESERFEKAFPWQMDLATRFLRFLPRRLAFAITRRMVQS